MNKRLLQAVLDKSGQPSPGNATQVYTDSYLDSARNAQERKQLFLQSPQVIAFSAELPEPNSYLPVEVLDDLLILTRDGDGELHGFFNSCRHRGTVLVESAGQARTISCPFHGWTYALSGELRGRPAADCFADGDDTDLYPVDVVEMAGLILLIPGGSDTPDSVNAFLGPLADELMALELSSGVALGRRETLVSANWKLITELSLESYHFNVLHRDSVAALLLDKPIFDFLGHHTRWAFPLRTITELQELPESQWPDELQGSRTYTLFPGVMIIVNASGAQMIRCEPCSDAGRSRVIYSGLRWQHIPHQSAVDAYNFGGEVFFGEDLPMAEQTQRGLKPGKQLTFGSNECLLAYWHTVWEDALNSSGSS